MKLKKIASLMLAGIMAVSMLAGCKDGASSSEPTKPETDNTVTASIATAMNGERNDNVKNLGIAYEDDSEVASALATAVNKLYKSSTVESAPNGYEAVKDDVAKVAEKLDELLPGQFYNAIGSTWQNKGDGDELKMAKVYTVGGSFDANTAAALVAQKLNGDMDNWLSKYNGLSASYEADVAAVKVSSKDTPADSTWVVAVVFTQSISANKTANNNNNNQYQK